MLWRVHLRIYESGSYVARWYPSRSPHIPFIKTFFFTGLMIGGLIFGRLTFGSSHCRSVRTFFYVKQTRDNVSREPTININRSTKIFVNFLTAIKYFRKYIFPHFLVAIADLAHPLSNNRSSIRIIGCYYAPCKSHVNTDLVI